VISRRQLIGLFSSALLPLRLNANSASNKTPWTNWSGALKANPASRFAPTSEAQLATWLSESKGPVRPVGAGHSFTPLVPTDGHLVISDRLSGLISHDPATNEAEFYAGTRISDTGPLLDGIGQAMYNLPDIDRQTLAGALATSTHGTGHNLKSLSGYVTGMRLITPEGEILDLDRDDPRLKAASVSLGALGVVSRVRFQNREPFRLLSRIWAEKTESILENFDSYTAQWPHFEMMPFLHADYSLVIAHQETTAPYKSQEAAVDDGEFLALVDATPVMLRGALINSIASGLEPEERIQPSFEALTNLRFDRFNEMEYSVPVEAGPACLREILAIAKSKGVDVVNPLEYRIVEKDDSWISMFSDSPKVSISVHRLAQYEHDPLFSLVEPIFWKYDGRPHWGKVHSLGYHELSRLYPRFDDFIQLTSTLDPKGKMLNAHLRRLFNR
jgi:FAD-linked oxidoreductase